MEKSFASTRWTSGLGRLGEKQNPRTCMSRASEGEKACNSKVEDCVSIVDMTQPLNALHLVSDSRAFPSWR